MVPKAVIFDMDGVLMDSEDLWRKAMKKAFAEFSFPITEAQCKSTMGMRINEVISHWKPAFGETYNASAIENRVMHLLLGYIASEGKFMEGIPAILDYCAQNNIPIGLATSSSETLMHAILDKLQISGQFSALCSAEHLPYGKPHPQVYLQCAEQLGVIPQLCIAIEDSLNGVISAKAARMHAIAVPDIENQTRPQFAVADARFNSLTEVLPYLQSLFSQAIAL